MIYIPEVPVLKTERLMLRPLKENDVNEIFLLRSDDIINKYVDRPKAQSPEDAFAFIKKIHGLTADSQSLYWAITLNGSDELIGTIALWNFDHEQSKAELGYEMLTQHQRKGYMY